MQRPGCANRRRSGGGRGPPNTLSCQIIITIVGVIVALQKGEQHIINIAGVIVAVKVDASLFANWWEPVCVSVRLQSLHIYLSRLAITMVMSLHLLRISISVCVHAVCSP